MKHRAIEPGYLARLYLLSCAVLLVCTAISTAIVWFVAGTYDSAAYNEAIRQIFRMKAGLLRIAMLSSAAQVLLAVVVLWILGVYASHKIAGPLVRFERCVRDLGEGNLVQSVRFRTGDQNQGLPDALARTCENLRARVREGARSAERISELAARLEGMPGPSLSDAELREVLAVAGEEGARLEGVAALAAATPGITRGDRKP